MHFAEDFGVDIAGSSVRGGFDVKHAVTLTAGSVGILTEPGCR